MDCSIIKSFHSLSSLPNWQEWWLRLIVSSSVVYLASTSPALALDTHHSSFSGTASSSTFSASLVYSDLNPKVACFQPHPQSSIAAELHLLPEVLCPFFAQYLSAAPPSFPGSHWLLEQDSDWVTGKSQHTDGFIQTAVGSSLMYFNSTDNPSSLI